ncbi:hypothetical protein P3G55_07220 [Leptospira sp. 96542]|nr:hypothetical protein [Leptospira sp. 96542]
MENKEQIVTKILQQVFAYHLSLDEDQLMLMDFADSEDFDGDNLYAVWEEINETFNVPNDKFENSENMADLIQAVTKYWDQKTLSGVDKNLKWVSMSEISMPFWDEENPNWEPNK